MTKYVTINEACEALDVSRCTIHRYIKRGVLKAYKFGRRTLIHPADLEALIQPIVT